MEKRDNVCSEQKFVDTADCAEMFTELSDLQLAYVGGGIGDTVL